MADSPARSACGGIERGLCVKAMTDEKLEAAIELQTSIVDQRLGEKAKVVEAEAVKAATPLGARLKARRLAALNRN